MRIKLLGVFLSAFFIRLISLNQSLWLDEAITAKVVQNFSYIDIVTKFSPSDFHPPLYYLFMKFWTGIIGYSEVALRLPSVIFSLLAGYVVYKTGSLIKDKKTGFWAMIFFLFNPLIIYYSQEARMYMMATFLLTGALYFLIKMLQVKSEKLKIKSYSSKFKINFVLFNIFSIFGFYTFYGAVFFILAMWFVLALRKKYMHIFLSFFFTLFFILPILPLLFQQLNHSHQALVDVSNWSGVLGKATIKNLLLIPIKFTSGRISLEPKLLYYLIAGGWWLVVSYFLFGGIRKNIIFGLLLILPIIFGLFFSFFSPLLQYFRFLYLIPIISLLLSFRLSRRSSGNLSGCLLILGFLGFSFVYLLFPRFHRENWRDLALSVKKYQQAYVIYSSSDPLQYYAPGLSLKELRILEGVEIKKEVIVIPYTADIYGFDYKKELRKKGFVYKERKDFRGVWYEIWVINKGYAGSFLNSFVAA